MSWYTDPELFLYCWHSEFYGISTITKKYNVPLFDGDIPSGDMLSYYGHLNLGDNKQSDYDALKAYLLHNSELTYYTNVKYVNCQGLVIQWDFQKKSGFWTQVEELTSIVKSLPRPNIQKLLYEKEDAETQITDLVEEKDELKNEVANLQGELSLEKNSRQALEKQVLDLTTKLQESCGGGGSGSGDVVQPWMSTGDIFPSHWVRFEDLDKLNLNLPTRTPLKTIMEEASKSKIVEDVTTNVRVNRFYRGTFIVAVNVEELSPDSEKARFDPEFWGLFKNGDVTYAARKPLDSEM